MYFQYGETEINYLKRKDKKLAWAIEQIGHIERKLDANLFAAVVRHIVGQQISSKAQATVWARLEARLKVVTPFTVHAASAEELQGLGMSLRKAEYIKDFADRIVGGEFDFCSALFAVHNYADEVNNCADSAVIVLTCVSISGVLIFFLKYILLILLKECYL